MWPARQPRLASVQDWLIDLEAVHDDVLVLKGGDTRALLAVTGVNLALKSAEERQAVLDGYRAFLNGLDTPVQAVCAIGPRNLESYLDEIRHGMGTHRSPALARLALDHLAFVQQLATRRALMRRRFFVVLTGPSLHAGGASGGRLARLFGRPCASAGAADGLVAARRQLAARADEVCQQLHGLGLGARRLGGDDLLQALDEVLAPDRAAVQRLAGPAVLHPPVVIRARPREEMSHAAA